MSLTRRPASTIFAAFSLMAGALAPAVAHAQRPSIDVRTFRPSTDPNASLVIEPAITPGHGVLSVSAYGHYTHFPVTLRRPGQDAAAYRPVANALGLDALVNYGIGPRFAIGAAVPVVVWQDGTRPLPAEIAGVDRVPTTAIGDVGVSMKGALVRNDNGGFGLAALGYVSLPTGERTSFVGEGSTTVTARLLAEYTLLVAVAQASVGYKLRTEHRTWPAPEAGGIWFGDELPWSAGLAMRPGLLGIDPKNRQRLEVAAHGWLPAGPVGPFGTGRPGSAALSPVLLALSDRYELGRYRDAYVLGGVDIGLTDAVGVPSFRVIAGIGWAPRDHDKDKDGVNDDLDGCPDIPEDRDGFEDSDGCPEIDNDDDGVIDREDACPSEKGAASRDPKKNGCKSADTDGDRVADEVDACPTERGFPSTDPRKNGCLAKDTDKDGIDDALDKCPAQAEDKDGFEDEDGCPDPDDDGDGVPDAEDACPREKGTRSPSSALNGCPSADRDGDTFSNDEDRCPDEPETFNGVTDDDGCADTGGKALVVIDDARAVKLAAPIRFVEPQPRGDAAPDVDPRSMPTVRALAQALAAHPDWTLAVGAQPGAGDPNRTQLAALGRSFAVVREISRLTRRDGIAETVGWEAVKNRPGATGGLGFLVLVTPPKTTAAPPAPLPRKTP